VRRFRPLGAVQGLAALHSRLEEREFADWSRRRAEEAEERIARERATGLLGSGRLADQADAGRAGLHDARGLFLGALHGRPLFYAREAHLMTYARTGSGKGRDTILPNLAHVRNRSLVVIDVKDGENAYASIEYRLRLPGHKIITLNPAKLLGLPDTRTNPLRILRDIVLRGRNIDTEAEEIAQILMPRPRKAGENDWVRKGAIRMAVARMEFEAKTVSEGPTLASLWRFANASDAELSDSLSLMASCGFEGIARRAASLSASFNSAPKQFEAYRSDLIDALNSFEPGKTLAGSTSAHEVDFGRLKHEPTTVYIMAPSEKLGVFAPWISLVLNTAIEAIAREMGPVQTSFLLDEFPQLPPAPAITKALRLYRGRGIQLWFFSQGRFSLEERWSREAVKEFEDQAAILTMTGVEDPSLMADIERWSGNTTVVMRGTSHSGGVIESAGASRGETKRPVLQSEDIRGVGDSGQIIRVASLPHLLVCDRVPFFKVQPWASQLRDVRDLHAGRATILDLSAWSKSDE
jgi:type IV secretion system protein VirD4